MKHDIRKIIEQRKKKQGKHETFKEIIDILVVVLFALCLASLFMLHC